MDARVRQLRIRSGVVRRLAKERFVYAREAEQQRERLQRAKSSGADEHVLRKHDEVLQEALMMVPDCARRLAKAQSELKEILDLEQDLKDSEDYASAVKILEDSFEGLSDRQMVVG